MIGACDRGGEDIFNKALELAKEGNDPKDIWEGIFHHLDGYKNSEAGYAAGIAASAIIKTVRDAL